MRRHISLLALVILGAATLYGQATRTWVSGVGDDANPCSRTAPCKTFAGAISKTAPGGEIDALDPGGFGALTITKSITLDGGGGQVASVLVAGTNGIVVAAGATDMVSIRNLRMDGLRGGGNANAGLNGIRFISGLNLDVVNCVIFGFNNNGIDIALGASGNSHILDCVLWNNAGDGVSAQTSSGLVQVGIEHTQITNSGAGNLPAGNNGVHAQSNSRVVMNNSLVQHSTGDGVKADQGTAQATVSYSDVSFNTNGLTATAGGSANSFSSNYAYNTSCSLNNSGAGSVVSFGGNRYIGSVACGVISPVNPM